MTQPPCGCATQLAAIRAELASLRGDMAALDRGLTETAGVAGSGLKIATDISDGIAELRQRTAAARLARLSPEERREQFELICGDAA